MTTQSTVNGEAASGESRAAADSKTKRGGCALITGASRGIGAATALALAQDGWTVGVNYNRDSAGAEQVCSAIRNAGGTALALPADVANTESTDAILEQLSEAAGPIRILVNNAGSRADNLSMRLSDEEWSRVLDVNLTAAFRLTRAVLRPMMRERFGRIVNVASVVGERANPGQASDLLSARTAVGAATSCHRESDGGCAFDPHFRGRQCSVVSTPGRKCASSRASRAPRCNHAGRRSSLG